MVKHGEADHRSEFVVIEDHARGVGVDDADPGSFRFCHEPLCQFSVDFDGYQVFHPGSENLGGQARSRADFQYMGSEVSVSEDPGDGFTLERVPPVSGPAVPAMKAVHGVLRVTKRYSRSGGLRMVHMRVRMVPGEMGGPLIEGLGTSRATEVVVPALMDPVRCRACSTDCHCYFPGTVETPNTWCTSVSRRASVSPPTCLPRMEPFGAMKYVTGSPNTPNADQIWTLSSARG